MYKSLDKKAINVMRINAAVWGLLITIIIILTVLLSYGELNNIYKIILIIFATIIVVNVLLNIFLYPVIRYSRYKYLITDEKIEVKRGLFWINRSIIQIKRIQKIDLNTGPIDRIYNLSNINIYTAAGVVSIRFINENEAQEISDKINKILKRKLESKNEN